MDYSILYIIDTDKERKSFQGSDKERVDNNTDKEGIDKITEGIPGSVKERIDKDKEKNIIYGQGKNR